MKISTATGFFMQQAEETHADAMEKIARFGFEAIDFGFFSVDYPALQDNWKPYIEELAEKAAALGLEVYQTHLPFYDYSGEIDQVKEDWVRKSIEATGILGAKYAVLHPAVSFSPEVDGKKLSMEYYKPFMELGAKHGVSILTENMIRRTGESYRYCDRPEELCELAEALDMGICWDFGHAQANAGAFDHKEGLKMTGSRLKALHVHDNYGRGADDHLLPFFGTIPWNDLIPVLKEIGYAGTFNYEVVRYSIPEYALPEAAAYLLKVAKTLTATLV